MNTMKRLSTLAIILMMAVSTAQAQTPPPPTSSLSLSTIAIKVTNVTGKPRDWIGIFPHGAANTAMTDWAYVACDGKSCVATPAKAGSSVSVHLAIPTNPGQVDVRYFTTNANGTFQLVSQVDPDFSDH
jgi:hypothetical protein